MNRLLSFFNTQQGIARRDFSYDFALGRLCVPREDDWRGIMPSTNSLDYNPEPPIFSAKFANCSNYKHILAMANEDGKIALHNTKQKNYNFEEKALEGEQCHYNAVFDLEWVPKKMAFVSASGDHTARLWEITESAPKLCRVFTGHTRSVKTVAFRKNDQAVFATGGRDGAILIWDSRAITNSINSQRADNCIYSGHAGGPCTPISQRKRTTRTPKLSPHTVPSSITGLVFQDDNTLVSCGAGDGIIKVWDLRRNYTCYKREPLPKHSLPYSGTSTFKGFTYLLCDEPGNCLYASCMDNTIYCYNLSSSIETKPIQSYIGLRNNTFYIKSCLSPDGNYLISGSSDERAYIWNLKYTQPLVTLNGHTVEVTCVAWSGADDMRIVTCSENARHKLWSIGEEKITDDRKCDYRGFAEYCKEYSAEQHWSKNLMRNRLQSLDRTPRSLRRIVEQNEKTPSSVEKIQTKRSFSEMTGQSYIDKDGSDQKRPHIETRGRRLFSPSTSISLKRTDVNTLNVDEPPQKLFKISPVLNHPNDSNQENTVAENKAIDNDVDTKLPSSPLTERRNFNVISSPTKSSMSTMMPFSPTSNLPNYVIDGDAPHLGIMSPKRKHKEKVDWLTKMRKQKLMSKSRTNDKLIETTTTPYCDNAVDVSSLSNLIQSRGNDFLSSPRLQGIRNSECCSTNVIGTPKRRISHSGDFSPQAAKTPRRNETTILRFFSTISNEQRQSRHSQDSNLIFPVIEENINSSTSTTTT